MEESSTEELPETTIAPTSEDKDEIMNTTEEETTKKDEIDGCFADYKREMLASGLCLADFDYLATAYKNLEDVKFIRLHCTSCDKHIGSAPNDLSNRYEHPLLKVLVCGRCFEFYSSGDFEKDEDGSELYCRWCGEGGQVFCCTSCPFVFCKKCIRRNLGRGIARVIENSDNWMCFACDPSQISRHRATYWAVQKFSDEFIKKSNFTGDTEGLNVDGNICCTAVKRRPDIYTKLMQPPKKKQKMSSKNNESWKPPIIAEQPEDEVICTPDILPLDISPPSSPVQIEPQLPPPLMPLPPQKTNVPLPALQPAPPPLVVRPQPPRRSMNITELQKHLQTKYSQIILTPRPKAPTPTNPPLILRTTASLMAPNSRQNNGNFKLVLSTGNTVPITTGPVNSNLVYAPVKPISSLQTAVSSQRTPVLRRQSPILRKQCPISPISISPSPVPTTSKNPAENITHDWFHQALIDCAELTEYISTKISSLSSVHMRAYKSELLMEELHNTFQTYMHIAFEKLNKIREITKQNFESDMEKNFKKKNINPFALKNLMKNKESNNEKPTTDSENSNSQDSMRKSKTKLLTTKNIEPSEVLFDMDVTNASDEEDHTSKNEKDDDSDSDVQEIIDESRNEVIQIMDSDEEEEKPVFQISDEVLEKIRTKFKIHSIPSKELLKCLSALIVLNNKMNQDVPELPSEDVLNKTEYLRRHVESKIITQIEKVLKDSGADIVLSETCVSENDENTNDNNNKKAKEGESSNCEETEGESDKEDNTNSKKTNNEKDKCRENGEMMEIKKSEEKLSNEDIDKTKDVDKNIGKEEPDDAKIEKEANEKKDKDEKIEKHESDNENGEEFDDAKENADENFESDSANQAPEEGNKFFGDIEEILGSSVVLKKQTSFGDAFSKFVCDNDIESDDDKESDFADKDDLKDKDYEPEDEDDETEHEIDDILLPGDKEIIEEIIDKHDVVEDKGEELEDIDKDDVVEDKDEELEDIDKDDVIEDKDEELEDINKDIDDKAEEADEDEEITAQSIEDDEIIDEDVESPAKNEESVNKTDDSLNEDNLENDVAMKDVSPTKNDAIPSKNDERTYKDDKSVSKNKEVVDDLKVNDPTIVAGRAGTPDILKDSLSMARELDMIPEYVKEICNKDNGSLSLPPDSITSISADEMEILMQGKLGDECDLPTKSDRDVVLNSEILALQQMAENCVTPVDAHKNSTECKG